MDNNLSSKLNTVNDNINMMRDGLGLDRNASIETVRTKVTEKRKVKPYKLSFKERKDAKIENLDLIDFSGCADLRNMFTSCSNVTNLDGIKDWDVSTTRYMSYAFDCCRKLKSINVNNWNTNTATEMAYMFARCDALTEIDLSNWTIDAATSVEGMFYQSISLKKINLRNATFRNVNYGSYIFDNAKSLEEIDLRSAVFSTRTKASLKDVFLGIPANCLIIVKDETEKAWVLSKRSDLTNVKTVAEYEAI